MRGEIPTREETILGDILGMHRRVGAVRSTYSMGTERYSQDGSSDASHGYQYYSSQHFALPIANCGLRLNDEALRVAVGMRLGLSLCVPHNCHCGTLVDAQGLQAMVCKKAPGKIARHHVLHDIIWPAFGAAGDSRTLNRGTVNRGTINSVDT